MSTVSQVALPPSGAYPGLAATAGEGELKLLADRLVRRLVGLAVLMLLIVWGCTAAVAWVERKDAIADAVRQNENLVLAFDEHIHALLDGLDQLAEVVGLQYRRYGRNVRLGPVLGSLSTPELVTSIAIVDEGGNVITSTGRAERMPSLDGMESGLHRLGKDHGLFVGKPVRSSATGAWTVRLTKRMDAGAGGPAGTVVLEIDPAELARFYDRWDLGPRGLVTLVGLDGVVRVRRSGGDLAIGMEISQLPLFERLTKSAKGAFYGFASIDGVSRYCSFRTMEHYPLVVAVGVAEEDVLAPVRQRVRNFVLLAAALTLVLGVSAYGTFALARRQARCAMETEIATARLRAFMDSMPDAGWMKDAQGRFIAVNAAYASRFGKPPSSFVGRTDFDFFPAPLAQLHRDSDEKVGRTGQALRYEGKREGDGKSSWTETIKAPVYDRAGRLVGTCGFARDMTERKQAEAAMRELNRALNDRAAAMAAANQELEAYAHRVSHDLHAPLRHIAGFSDLLQRHLADRCDDRAHHLFGKIESATRTMRRFVDALLEFSRSEKARLEMEAVALDHVVREARDSLAPETAGRRIVWSIAPLPVVRGNATLLTLAFHNLLGNAVKYSSKRAIAHIEVDATVEETETIVRVRDDGAGFDMKDAERIFEMFERLHATKEFDGAGIGLATVKRIVDRHGGRIWAEGAPDGGATVFLAFPLAPPAGPSQAAA